MNLAKVLKQNYFASEKNSVEVCLPNEMFFLFYFIGVAKEI
jgi:hypothetical protein